MYLVDVVVVIVIVIAVVGVFLLLPSRIQEPATEK